MPKIPIYIIKPETAVPASPSLKNRTGAYRDQSPWTNNPGMAYPFQALYAASTAAQSSNPVLPPRPIGFDCQSATARRFFCTVKPHNPPHFPRKSASLEFDESILSAECNRTSGKITSGSVKTRFFTIFVAN